MGAVLDDLETGSLEEAMELPGADRAHGRSGFAAASGYGS